MLNFFCKKAYESGFKKGTRAMFDYFQIRAANNFHGNPEVNLICDQENEIVLSWANDALEEVDINSFNTWKEINNLMQENHKLKMEIKKLKNGN